MSERSGAPRWLATVLLVGTALLGAGAALHPMLPGTLPGQLAVIAQTTHWRAIHLVMLVGSLLVIVGIWGQLPTDEGTARRMRAVIFLAVVIGLALNASNIAFMAQTGTTDALRYVQGDGTAAAGFAQGHDASLRRAEVGNGLVALACLALAAASWGDQRQPRLMSALAALAGVGGSVGVVAFDPASRGAVTAVALFCVWAAIAAIRVLGDPQVAVSPPTAPAPRS
jgi:hypothetical protein